MSGQRDITLRSGHATPSTIVLRALPVATASTTTIYLYDGDATPSTIILRDPTTLAATGGAQSYTLTATPATLTLAGAVAALTVARRLTALPGALVLTGAEATLRVWRTLTALPGALTLTGADAALTYTQAPEPEGGARPTAGDYGGDAILGLGGRPTIKPEVVEREAERRGVEPEAARVVESVAVAIPAGATEVDASRELLRALEASRIEWRRAYDDLLTWYVGVLREIAALRQAQLDDDNAAILLLLMEH